MRPRNAPEFREARFPVFSATRLGVDGARRAARIVATSPNRCRLPLLICLTNRHSCVVMPTFTLDTNCLIALDEGRPESAAIRAIAAAHGSGTAHAAVVAISASENPKPGMTAVTNFAEFQARLAHLGLGRLEILRPLLYWDITFWDWAEWASPETAALERQLHAVLFPNDAFLYEDYCHDRGLDPKVAVDRRWRNQKCDVLAIWSHIRHGRDVFVTSDANFHAATKKAALLALGAKTIERPDAAAAMI